MLISPTFQAHFGSRRGPGRIRFKGFTTGPSVAANDYYLHPGLYVGANRTIMALNLWTANIGDGPYSGNTTACAAKAQTLLIATPEPGTLLLMGLGLIGLAGLRRKV